MLQRDVIPASLLKARDLHVSERQLRQTTNYRSGSRHDRHLFEFIAGKWSVKFRHQEAACRSIGGNGRLYRASSRTANQADVAATAPLG